MIKIGTKLYDILEKKERLVIKISETKCGIKEFHTDDCIIMEYAIGMYYLIRK